DLDPQPLAVEAVLVPLVVSEQPVVPLPYVLQRPAPGVVDAHRVVGRDRPVEERPALVPFVLLTEPFERPFVSPAVADGVLDPDVVGLFVDWFEGHGAVSPGRRRAPSYRRSGSGRPRVSYAVTCGNTLTSSCVHMR